METEALAQKLIEILEEAVPGAGKVVSVLSIVNFIEFLKQKVGLMIEEGIIASALLEKFTRIQAQNGVHILCAKNIGMILIVAFILAMKMSRDVVFKNSYFADAFGVSIQDLNRSESGFLRFLDHRLWVDEIFIFKEQDI
ncbi:MAG: hypothetical protein EZS28_010847 [Streblomastix strix]|uniref:Cyclin N-terminal domain-containing protein n=1 Tax=Streblomastix strix TaxID=222440 RepID=A0A5J4WF78_9EUKA|nr:MAG: hypothetical protein EZS28_010847 [Streblomastix strix]